MEAYAPTADGGCTCKKGSSCDSPGKHPKGDDWQKRATRAPTIAQLVGRSGQFGVVPRRGERGLILDVDHPDRLPFTCRRLCGSGAAERGHAYFRLPEGFDPAGLPPGAP